MEPAPISCPACGWTPGTHAHAFLYIEEVTSMRWVMGVDATGAIRVDASDHIATDECGRAPRLQCSACLTEFPLQWDVRVEFVC